ncbi:cytochrome P450 [Phlebopus sp. FC_14]|nr:cytochrome P450 [Phlebopus sp. FC_14]
MSPLDMLHFGAFTVGLILIAKLLKKRNENKTRALPLPPGPSPLPIVGNALNIRTAEPWVTYTEWSARYGDIYTIRFLNQDIIIISSEKIARTLLERRSSVYSDRPYLATREPYGWAFHFAWTPYGDKWRSQRRMFHQVFRPDAIVPFRPMQLQKAHLLASGGYATGTIMSMVYDYEIEPDRDHMVELFDHGISLGMEALTPESAAVVNTFPFVLSLPVWVPGIEISRKATESVECVTQMLSRPFEYARLREAEGTASPSMVSDTLRNFKRKDDPNLLQLLKETCGAETVSISIAIFPTSLSVLQSATVLHCLLLAMVQNPRVQKRAQAEIDEIIGMDRLPTFEDRPSLPYVEAVMRETFRLYPVTPLGLPHATISDDIFDGYFIPKGCTIVANIWYVLETILFCRAMLRNESVYPDANSFKPERHFVDGKLNDDSVISSIGFGFGRRNCPGRHSADVSLWAAIVTILATLVVSKAVDERGNEIEVNPRFTYGVTSRPGPFTCAIKPRRPGLDIVKLAQHSA